MVTVLKNNKLYKYNKTKIIRAIIQAYNQISIPNFERIDIIIKAIENEIYRQCSDNIIDVKTIENIVMSKLYKHEPAVAREYSQYKIDRERAYNNPTPTEQVLLSSKEISQENANKNSELAHIKNAYLAEIPSKERMRNLLPKECLEAHDKGIVYFHDMGYSARPISNCELLNLDHLLQNGFDLNGTWIEKPKSFQTACTIATQILTHVASNTYGGCTINLLHLAKFVDVSRKKIKKQVIEEVNNILLSIGDTSGFEYEKTIEEITKKRLLKEIQDGIQTFTYQNLTLCSNVGQAVFLTISVYLNEEPQYANDLILVYKEMLKQRIQGIKNEKGIYENPNFPKILYFLDKDTMKGGKYYDITKLCAECSAKRLVPDYMSVKKHIDLKGVVTPSMGKRNTIAHVKSFELCQKVSV